MKAYFSPTPLEPGIPLSRFDVVHDATHLIALVLCHAQLCFDDVAVSGFELLDTLLYEMSFGALLSDDYTLP
jgi:hypothetical protein